MTSPPDIYAVEIDEEAGLFVIIRNSGTVSNVYSVDEEPDLFFRILDWGEQGVIEVREVNS